MNVAIVAKLLHCVCVGNIYIDSDPQAPIVITRTRRCSFCIKQAIGSNCVCVSMSPRKKTPKVRPKISLQRLAGPLLRALTAKTFR